MGEQFRSSKSEPQKDQTSDQHDDECQIRVSVTTQGSSE